MVREIFCARHGGTAGLTTLSDHTIHRAFGLQYDGAGRLQSQSSFWNPALGSSGSPLSLFTADLTSGYTAQGALQNAVLSNNIFVSKTYDNRLRTTSETALEDVSESVGPTYGGVVSWIGIKNAGFGGLSRGRRGAAYVRMQNVLKRRTKRGQRP